MFNKILFIGDPHFKINNNNITDIFVEECLKTIDNLLLKYNKQELLCILAGDILDTHERLHQTPYNKALKFIKEIKNKITCVILVGNHDYENNQQFLSDKHWMNPLKEWSNVYIVDKVLHIDDFIFVPYVPVGRFIEALETLSDIDWRNSKCIFAHQEFKGCSLGNMNTKSENGDKWPVHYPLVISGHIHKNHRPQKNIIYPGSIIQHNFGEEDNKNSILFIDFSKDIDDEKFTEITINIPSMKTINIPCENFNSFIKNLKIKPLQRIRIICNGTEEQFKRIRKTTIYNNLPIGIYVTFKNNLKQTEELNNKPLLFKTFDELINENLNKEEKDILSLTSVGKKFNDLISI